MRATHTKVTALGVALLGLLAAGCQATVGGKPLTAQPGKPTSEVVMAPSLKNGMRRITLELVARGLQPDARAFAGFLPNGNHATFPVRVPAHTCATVVALATKNVSDVDAALYTPEGELVVLDSEPDPHPTLQVCTGASARDFYYVIQLYDGDGSFVVRPFYGARPTLAAAASVVGGRPAFADIEQLRNRAGDPLSDLREGMRKRGFTEANAPVVFRIAERERVRATLQAESATCYTVAAFGGQGLRRINLRVLDEQGAPLGIGEGSEASAALQLCARERASYTVETEAASGAGEVTLVMFRADVVVAGGDAGLWLGHREAAKSGDGAR